MALAELFRITINYPDVEASPPETHPDQLKPGDIWGHDGGIQHLVLSIIPVDRNNGYGRLPSKGNNRTDSILLLQSIGIAQRDVQIGLVEFDKRHITSIAMINPQKASFIPLQNLLITVGEFMFQFPQIDVTSLRLDITRMINANNQISNTADPNGVCI